MFKFEMSVYSKSSHGVAMPSFNCALVGPGIFRR